MIKRLLIVLTIAGGVVMVPYLLLPPEPEYLYPTGYIFITYSSIVKYFITYFVLCYLIGEHKKLFKYVRYGSFVLLLFLGLGVKGQTRSSGFIAIPAQEYFRLKDSVNKLNRVNDTLMKGVVLYLNHWIDELLVNDSLKKELDKYYFPENRSKPYKFRNSKHYDSLFLTPKYQQELFNSDVYIIDGDTCYIMFNGSRTKIEFSSREEDTARSFRLSRLYMAESANEPAEHGDPLHLRDTITNHTKNKKK